MKYNLLGKNCEQNLTVSKTFLDWLKKDMTKFLEKDRDIQQILFIEGQIWSRLYDSFKHFLPQDFLIDKRIKRPPDNPMNALISFGNTLLYTKTITAYSF